MVRDCVPLKKGISGRTMREAVVFVMSFPEPLDESQMDTEWWTRRAVVGLLF